MIILLHYGQNQGQVLASAFPELAEQWNYDKNGMLTPWMVTIGSNKKVWWKCSLGHEWETAVASRTSDSTGCPYCAGKKAWPGFNDLATLRPDIAADWNDDKNAPLTPQKVTPGSNKKVWWKCALGHEWEAPVRNRTYNATSCPYCAGKKALPGFNDLATLRPDMAAEWDYARNGALTPQAVTLGSHKKVWWKCSLGHEWEAPVHNRTQNSIGCPYCTGRYVMPGFNDLATLRPELAADWDYSLNGKVRPELVTVCAAKKVWWVCRKGHPSYLMTVFNRSNGRGCPECRPERIAASKRKKVLYFAPDGRLLGTYPSIEAAAGKTGRSRNTVAALCAGRKTEKNGTVYRFADDLPENMGSPPGEMGFRDCLSQPVSVGDPVMFIRHTRRESPKLMKGRVSAILERSVCIQTETGTVSRLLVSRDDPYFLPKLLVLHPRPERKPEDSLDASGYPVREGDPVVYMPPLLDNKCREFLFGIVKKTAASFWEVDGVRRPADRMIVVNW